MACCVKDNDCPLVDALKVQLAAARTLIAGLDGLLVCYRLGRRPTDKLLDSIKASRAALAATANEGGDDE